MNSLQKSIKIIAICFAVFIITNIVSAILFGVSLFINIISPNKNTKEYTNTYSFIENIDIEIGATNLTIKEGAEFKLVVNNVPRSFKETYQNNTLKIKENNRWFYQKKASNIILYIPKEHILSEIIINSGAGKVKLDEISATYFNINQGAGTVAINNSYFNNTIINGGVGEFIVDNSVLSNLDLNTGVGNVVINSEITGDSKIDSGIGKVNLNLNNKEEYKLNITKGIGSVYIDKIKEPNDTVYGTGKNNIIIESGIGEININFSN